MHTTNPFRAVAPTKDDAANFLAAARNRCAQNRPIADTAVVRDVLSSFASHDAHNGNDHYLFTDGLSLNACFQALTGDSAIPPIPDGINVAVATILDGRLAISFPLTLGKHLNFAPLYVLGGDELRPEFSTDGAA